MQFVRLESDEKHIQSLKNQIEKYALMSYWVSKSESLFDAYLSNLDMLSNETDSVRRGELIRDLESYFMSSILTYMRCFSSQTSTYLEINHVTKDKDLRSCYSEMHTLRNHEFVHWQGERSKLTVQYSFNYKPNNQCEFAEQIQINISDSIGPAQRSHELKRLFKETNTHLESRRAEKLTKLRKALSLPENWKTTQFYNEQNEPLIKKTTANLL